MTNDRLVLSGSSDETAQSTEGKHSFKNNPKDVITDILGVLPRSDDARTFAMALSLSAIALLSTGLGLAIATVRLRDKIAIAIVALSSMVIVLFFSILTALYAKRRFAVPIEAATISAALFLGSSIALAALALYNAFGQQKNGLSLALAVFSCTAGALVIPLLIIATLFFLVDEHSVWDECSLCYDAAAGEGAAQNAGGTSKGAENGDDVTTLSENGRATATYDSGEPNFQINDSQAIIAIAGTTSLSDLQAENRNPLY